MKQLNQILTIVMSAFTGAFLGHGLYLYWDFRTHPALYEMQSAPWYARLFVPCGVLVTVLLVGTVLKLVILKKQKKP